MNDIENERNLKNAIELGHDQALNDQKGNDVFLLGDIHGDFTAIYKWLNTFCKKGDSLIQLGDFGAGMISVEKIEELAFAAKQMGVKIYVLRGNHDNPEYFNLSVKVNDSLEFVPDYTVKKINGLNYLFLGGAISIDRKKRKEGFDYWKAEGFVYHPNQLLKYYKNIDVVVSHTAPEEVRPFYGMGPHPDLVNYQKEDVSLEKDLKEEKDLITKAFDIVKPNLWAFGHFHQYHNTEINGTKFVCLGIDHLEMILL